MKWIILISLSLFLTFSCDSSDSTKVKSPNQKIIFTVFVDEMIEYSINVGAAKIIDQSELSFEFQNMPILGKDMEIINITNKSVDESWKPVLKRYESIRNNYNEVIIEMKEKNYPSRNLNMEIRVYDDGVAFRMHFLPADKTFENVIMNELTQFNFHSDYTCWAVDYKEFDSHQESEFVEHKLSEITNDMLIGLPLTIKFNGRLYGAVTEAALIDYAGMYLSPNNQSGDFSLKSQLAPRHGQEREGEKVLFKGAHSTPWRVILLGETPGKLVESEIIQNLNAPCEIDDPSWIKPGVSAWDHWWSGEVLMEQDVIYEYIDLASEMYWEYMLIDWQWYGQFDQADADIMTVAPQLNMEEILDYAKTKKVKCWLWLYWTDVDKADFDAACKLYHDWGIAGVKIDFMARDDQEMVNWYHNVVKTAAKHHLMVDFHGAYKPTGWRRTYPNLMTREGVMGNEYQKWSYRVTPEHDCTIPFTRMLAGPMDYTPGGFLNCNAEDFKTGSPARVQGTRAHELAKFVIYDSPFLVACDHPDNYKLQAGRGFLKEVESEWDDTRVLNGSIGEYITMLRRTNDKWFIGAMTNSQARSLP
jgi:alpha-glucosidase